jgi:hypothetical protein
MHFGQLLHQAGVAVLASLPLRGALLLAQLVQVRCSCAGGTPHCSCNSARRVLQGGLFVGLVLGVAQHAHQLLVELVEHVVGVGAAGRLPGVV